MNLRTVDIILVVAHHTDDRVNILMLPHHRAYLWTKMILDIRLLENCLILNHQTLHTLIHLWHEHISIDIIRLMTVNIVTYVMGMSLIVIQLLNTWPLSIEAISHSMQAIKSHIINTGAIAVRRKNVED